ncbi:Dual specificity mitogen-activated protein kinase kinase 2 [Fusarium oxysporum f. sp. rapae]|uniref:Dual specificity mitogen-activated protein kinase kinase 2 n=1 Tax=Fusarium oxysporum f. sp. rapae TaxID=485398 RepID=A0A8J5PDU4_FUSOX|nr:Dual specificity mitogen-activated protein kinase kinase 2 [Fusarium oxysporum f. sp. rapae]
MFNPRKRPRDERHGEFIRYVRQESQPGLDGNDIVTRFISPAVTARWWRKSGQQRLSRAIDRNIHALPTTIENGYLNIFSILVYIGRTYLINNFTSNGYQDQRLPLLNARCFGDDPALVDDMNEFCENQWMFCPLIFSRHTPMDKRYIDPRQILPIKTTFTITTDSNHSKSIIRVVTLYPECFDHEWSPTGSVVFKEYRTREREGLRDAWIKEYNAFAAIESCDYIVKYLGSFEQNNRCFMILEHASEGSLLELFKRNERPATEEERRYFLYGLMGLTKAIDKIQNLGGGPRNQRTGFAHRDIKPANILVFPGQDGRYSYGFQMKLADFDTATPNRPIDEDESSFQDNDGNRTYCSPEATRFYRDQEKGFMQVPVASDVWSLGCVISEAIVWVAGGTAALDEAANDRRREIRTHWPLLAEGSFGECFHNSSTALTCVVKSHSAALDALQGPIFLSRNVCSLVEHWMLVPHRERQYPILIWKAFEGTYRDLFHPAPPSGHYSAPLLPQPGFHNTTILTQSPVNMASSVFQPDQTSHQRPFSHPGPSTQIGMAMNHPNMHQGDPLGINTRMPSNNGTPIDRHISTQWSHSDFRAVADLEDKSSPVSAVSTNELNRGHSLCSPKHPGISFSTQGSHHHSVPDANSPAKTSVDIHRLTPQKQQNGGGMYGDLTIGDVLVHRSNNGKREALEGYEQFYNRMGRRRFVFIIDDSVTMRNREREVLRAMEVLVWLVRKIDQNGPEIRFASKPDIKYPIERRPRFLLKMDKFINPVRKWFRGNDAETFCNMKHSFNRIFADANMVDPKRPTSVIILTDGIWEGGGPTEEKGVEACITNVIKRMEEKGLGDTAFTFQFLSFGNDPDGLRRLIYLDDHALYGGNEHNRIDIVDHKSSESNVWAILTGSVSPGNDEASAGPSTGRPSFSQGE